VSCPWELGVNSFRRMKTKFSPPILLLKERRVSGRGKTWKKVGKKEALRASIWSAQNNASARPRPSRGKALDSKRESSSAALGNLIGLSGADLFKEQARRGKRRRLDTVRRRLQLIEKRGIDHISANSTLEQR